MTVPEDPVVVYDIMRESANRLAAVYIEHNDHGSVRLIRAWVRAIDTRDQTAQTTATETLTRLYQHVTAGERVNLGDALRQRGDGGTRRRCGTGRRREAAEACSAGNAPAVRYRQRQCRTGVGGAGGTG